MRPISCERSLKMSPNFFSVTDVCVLPKLVGPCRAAFPRWHFNSRVQRCERFTYGGCAGNGNNFKSEDDCNNQCVCRLPKAQGVCKGYFPSWFFNIETGKCEEFVYGGCGGNMNRFYNKERCEEACGEGEGKLTDLYLLQWSNISFNWSIFRLNWQTYWRPCPQMTSFRVRRWRHLMTSSHWCRHHLDDVITSMMPLPSLQITSFFLTSHVQIISDKEGNRLWVSKRCVVKCNSTEDCI